MRARKFLAGASGLSLLGLLAFGAAQPAGAAESITLPTRHWSFEGFFGTYDRAALQRGFEVYRQVCSACHSLNMIAFRNLGPDGLGLSDDEVKAIAASYQVTDGPNDQGEMFQRPGKPSDYIPPPFPNEQAARAANNGALPPDLSLIAKAREGGADYIHALLTGFVEPPADFKVLEGMHYNAYFPGHQIAMPPPLSDGAVTYADGTPATVDQMASDVAQFLTWTAEPKLENRKQTGVGVVLFLVVLTGMLYATKRKVWAALH
ncbi:MAG: cytochrome c1 [Rhodospirillaceae bacterium]|nr:cytochrome c1 [Rhodospirillaceae bacterium]